MHDEVLPLAKGVARGLGGAVKERGESKDSVMLSAAHRHAGGVVAGRGLARERGDDVVAHLMREGLGHGLAGQVPAEKEMRHA